MPRQTSEIGSWDVSAGQIYAAFERIMLETGKAFPFKIVEWRLATPI